MKPEIFFLRYAFPCSFVLLLRKEITKKEHELLYRSTKEEKLFLTKGRIEGIFWRALKFIESVSSLESVQKYWWFDHNQHLKHEKFKDFDIKFYKDCMVIPCEVVSVRNNEATVKSKFFDGYKKLKTDFVDVKPGDRVTKHYDYACEKISESLYSKMVENLEKLSKSK